MATRPSPCPRLTLITLFTLTACGPASDLTGPAEGAPDLSRVPEAIASEVAAGRSTRVLVVLDRTRLGTEPPEVELLLGPAAAGDRVLQFASAKQDLFAAAPAGLQVMEDFEQLPMAFAQLDSAEALAHLVADPRVARLVPDTVNTISLAQSLPLVRQAAAALEGKDGTGTAIAILDTGADYRVADLGGCTAVGTPASCRVVYAQDFAVDDGLLDDSVRHGTNTASIAAAVAPGAKIIALDVFDGRGASSSTIISAINWVIANRATYHIASMNLSLGGGSFSALCDSDPMAIALNEARQVGVLAAVATGNSGTLNAISSPACASAAVSVGAVYDSNAGALNGSCSDATTWADKVTCFSNAASFQTLLAPGAFISAGGVSMAGTSQAAPHVAGALAVLRGAFPTETPAELVARLTSSGKSVTDARTGRIVPRLDLAAASVGCVVRLTPATTSLAAEASTGSLDLATSAACSWNASSSASWLSFTSASAGSGPSRLTFHADANPGALRTGTITLTGSGATVTALVSQGVDTTPPTGTVSVNGGATWTRSATVALTITASDPSGVAGMCVTNGTTCSTYQPFAVARTWQLGTANGTQTVRVFFKDTRGNVSLAASAASDAIVLDTTAPVGAAATATYGNGSVALTWTAATDATSGLDLYRVVAATGATAPTSCATGTVVHEGTDLAFTHQGLTNGTSYAYRVCALDKAGNLSAGSTASALPRPESLGPVASLSINGGASLTSSPVVTLSIGATDASAVTQLCLSTSATTCTAWEPYAVSRPYTLAARQGLATLFVRLKDAWGNVSSAAATASIVLDTAPPTGGALTAALGDGAVTLTWTPATDATSGVAGYRVVYATGAKAPASCAVGAVASASATSPFVHPGLTNGTSYAYRVCAVDGAGNTAVGLTASATPRPESVGPVGSIVLAGGAAWTRSTSVIATLSATDASPVTQMCLGTGTTCTAWVPYAAQATVTVTSTAGVKTVSAWFKDAWGNVSAPASDTIALDALPPSQPVLGALAGSKQVTLNWTAATDAGSGVASYRLVMLPGLSVPLAACATGAVLAAGAATSFVHGGLTPGAAYAYRLCAMDVVGNVSAGATAVVKPLP